CRRSHRPCSRCSSRGRLVDLTTLPAYQGATVAEEVQLTDAALAALHAGDQQAYRSAIAQYQQITGRQAPAVLDGNPWNPPLAGPPATSPGVVESGGVPYVNG